METEPPKENNTITPLPHQNANFTFRNVSFSVKVGKNEKPKLLLDNITGQVVSGQVVAIMGASGIYN